MKLFLIMLIYLITFFSISFEIIKDAHFTLSLKSQEFLIKKKFMLYESKGSWNNNYGNYGTFFSIDQFKVLQIVTEFY